MLSSWVHGQLPVSGALAGLVCPLCLPCIQRTEATVHQFVPKKQYCPQELRLRVSAQSYTLEEATQCPLVLQKRLFYHQVWCLMLCWQHYVFCCRVLFYQGDASLHLNQRKVFWKISPLNLKTEATSISGIPEASRKMSRCQQVTLGNAWRNSLMVACDKEQ